MLLFNHSQSKNSKVEQKHYAHKHLLQTSTLNLTGLKAECNHLRIGQKISYGYDLAIGIAILGTGAGMKLGDYFRKQALVEVNVAQQQQQMLQNLQNTVFEARSHAARLPVVLGNTVWLKYEQERFFGQINQAKILI